MQYEPDNTRTIRLFSYLFLIFVMLFFAFALLIFFEHVHKFRRFP